MRKLKLLLVFCLVAIAASAADFTDGGKYYLKNTASGKFWGAGSSWGTQATLVEHPEYVWLHQQSDGQYTIESQVSDGGSNKYFGGDFMDSDNAWWLTFTKNADNKYTIASGTNYFGYDGATTVLGKNLDASSSNVLWEVFSEADMRTALEAATVDEPVDATWLILNPNFGRNNRWGGSLSTNNDQVKNADLGSAWTFDASNKNVNGDVTNYCVESWHATFTMSQALSSIPNGTYKMTAQGFYRQEGSDNDNLPYFYANDEKQTFPLKTGSENSMSDASASFTNGSYTIDPIWVYVTDGSLTVGAKNESNTALWCIWDNFALTYYGNVTITEAKLANFVNAYKAALAAAQAYQSVDMFDADKTALNTAISENTLDLTGDVTEDNLTTATANLNAAAEAAATSALKYATYTNAQSLIGSNENVDLTPLIVNPSFEQGTNGWTVEGGLGPQSNDSFGKTGTYYLEYWQPNGTKSVTQTVGYLPAGLYKMEVRVKARGVTSAKVFAGGIEQAVTVEDTENEYTVNFALDEKTDALIGFEGVGTGAGSSWFALDNFRLTFVGGLPTELAAVTGKMNADVAAAQTAAVEAYNATQNVENYNAASAAITAAQASVDAYASAAAAIAKAEALKEANNFVTATAATTFAEAIANINTPYNEGTLTDADAAAAGTTLGVVAVGWHAAATNTPASNYIGSTWPATYTINDWSVEGESDGSNFVVPFFQNWTNDDNSLAATTMTGTLEGLTSGTYKVKAWVRVRAKNEVAAADATGITMDVNGADAVDVTEGTQVGTTQFQLAEYEATGYVLDDGILSVNFNIASDNNVSWLSYQSICYERTGDIPAADATDYAALTAAIQAVSSNVAGFEAGEYAPYNNVEAFTALAAAQAIDPTTTNVKTVVMAATNALTTATWTANTEEVNAIYDGSFNLTTKTDGTYILPIGWTNLGYNTRVYNSSNMGDNTGVNATSQTACMFAKFTTEYGTEAGYTMPLKAGDYVLEFIYGGWNEVGTRDIKIYCGETAATVNPVTVTAKDNTAYTNVDSWSSYKGLVTIPADGDYVLSFYRQSTTAQNQIAISDIVLKKAPVYAVVGSGSFFSGLWDQATTTDMLTLTDGVYTKTYTDIELEKQTIEYKFIKKATADATTATTWYPADNQTIEIPVKGKYDITFTFDETNVTGVATKTAEAVTIGEKGWATTVTNSALNFSGAEVEAYTAKVVDSKVELTKVDDVQAETGLVLKGAEGTYYIPVIEGSETEKGDLLHSSIYSYDITDDELGNYTFYGLTVNSDNKAQFVKLNKGTIPAQKAFLKVANTTAREMSVFFADDTTGINVIAAENGAEGIFNLNGQKVQKAQKGLYIVNGKKVMVK
ncbi:MAG: hypothetical protein IJT53_07010 [Prevotella sp.]|nr:hypothetical protein [Prevotella sp.]